MNAEIINIGSEIMSGMVINTNAAFISKNLDALGIKVNWVSAIGSDLHSISKALNTASMRSSLVIVTGGLGPFLNDNTKKACCNIFNLKLIMHKGSRKKIIEHYQKLEKDIPEAILQNAYIPKNASVIANDLGLVPGFYFAYGKTDFVFLPGTPAEMELMFEKYVMPLIVQDNNLICGTRTVNIASISKFLVEKKISSLLKGNNPKVVLFETHNECKIKVTATSENSIVANNLCDSTVAKIKQELGDNVYGVEYNNVSEKAVELLKINGKTVATAESCTAGLISALITSVPEASRIFSFGVSTYSNKMKILALNVKSETIENYGAVSGHTAAEMAIGVKDMSGDSIGISITGVAGPAKSEAKPVGLVYIGLADGEKVWVFKRQIDKRKLQRNIIRDIASSTAMDILRRYLENSKSIIPFGTQRDKEIHIVDFDSLILKSIEKDDKSVDFTTNQSVFSDDELAEQMNKIIGNYE